MSHIIIIINNRGHTRVSPVIDNNNRGHMCVAPVHSGVSPVIIINNRATHVYPLLLIIITGDTHVCPLLLYSMGLVTIEPQFVMQPLSTYSFH